MKKKNVSFLIVALILIVLCNNAAAKVVFKDIYPLQVSLAPVAGFKCIHHCDALSTPAAYGSNDLPVYQVVGFRKIYNSECWLKYYGEYYEILR